MEKNNNGLLVTKRQIEVLQAIADGKTIQEISKELGLSTQTVRTHIRDGMQRLGVRTRTRAIVLLMRSGQVQ